MKPDKWRTALALLISFCFLATSCTNTRVTAFPNEQTPNTPPDVAVGNTVRVTLKTGEVRRFEVTAIKADELDGKDIRVPYKDMQFLEVEKTSVARSLGVVLGIVAVAGAAAVIHLFDTIKKNTD